GEVDDAVEAAEGDGGFSAIAGEGFEPRSPTACQNDRQDAAHSQHSGQRRPNAYCGCALRCGKGVTSRRAGSVSDRSATKLGSLTLPAPPKISDIGMSLVADVGSTGRARGAELAKIFSKSGPITALANLFFIDLTLPSVLKACAIDGVNLGCRPPEESAANAAPTRDRGFTESTPVCSSQMLARSLAQRPLPQ